MKPMIFRLSVLLLLLYTTAPAGAQLVPCRPRMAMVYYWGHDDQVSNPAMTTILSVRPDILIDNTPGGLWSGGCLPVKYAPSGIKVYSYITAGYENSTRGGDTSQLAANLLRIDAIALDSAEGVFLDEVSHHPNTSGMDYITAIRNRCIAKGLKLILNPGTPNFDTALMSRCDYLMSDEQYTGTRAPNPVSEAPFLEKIIVVAHSVTSAATAAMVSLGARKQCFAYSYACTEYASFPAWINDYSTLISNQKPDTPTIHFNYGTLTLHSDAPCGNQWYIVSNTVSPIPGATGQDYRPGIVNASFYSIVTLDGCSSAPSNIIYLVFGGLHDPGKKQFQLYPNPASTTLRIGFPDGKAGQLTYRISDITGKPIGTGSLAKDQVLHLPALPNGIYLLSLTAKEVTESHKLVITR